MLSALQALSPLIDHLNENMQGLFIESFLWQENQPPSPVVGRNSKAGREVGSLYSGKKGAFRHILIR